MYGQRLWDFALSRKKQWLCDLKILVSFLARKSTRLAPLCKVIQRWWRVKWHAFLSPLDKIVSTSLGKAYTYFADVNLWKFLYCCTKLLSWSTWPLETHVKLDKKIVCFLTKSLFDSKDEKLWTWVIEVKMSCLSFAKPSYRNITTTIKMLADLLSQTCKDIAFICQHCLHAS